MHPTSPPLPDLADVLRRHPIFGGLEEAVRADLAARFTVQRFGAGDTVAAGASLQDRLGLVLEGRLALARDGDQASRAVLEGMAVFGAGAVPYGFDAGWSATAEVVSAIAFLPADAVARLCAQVPAMALFLVAPASSAPALPGLGESHFNLLATPLRALLKRGPVTVSPNATILEAAQVMRDQRVSAVMLLEREHLFGLVTDRDLRNRAVAVGMDTAAPVCEIATLAPLTIDIAQPAIEALLLMARQNVHHLPVLDGQRVAGMITATDVTEQHSTSAVYLASDIYRQSTIEGLAGAAVRVKQLQRNLAAAGASAYSTGHVVTAITDAITTRLLQLGEARLGPPPVAYAWVATGSQARSEQTAKSDQDNCMVLADDYDEIRDGPYFKALANFVNDGLDSAGYIYCPGEMMARTDEWRQPLRRWKDYFYRWTQTPEPKALMLTCVFFDMRMIHGRASIVEELRRDVLDRTRDNRIFLAYMVGNALSHRPPLSLFGGISTVRAGDVRDAVNLKHSGIVPVVDLARIYALAGGHAEVNTYDRLVVAASSREITEQSAHDLRDALEFMSKLRIRHQANQLAQGKPADNFLSLGDLSNFERGQLKNAFDVVDTLQSVLAQRYR